MTRIKNRLAFATAAWLALLAPSQLVALHFDVLVQSVDSQLVTGATNFDLVPPVHDARRSHLLPTVQHFVCRRQSWVQFRGFDDRDAAGRL
jgi:hypothetical protein